MNTVIIKLFYRKNLSNYLLLCY